MRHFAKADNVCGNSTPFASASARSSSHSLSGIGIPDFRRTASVRAARSPGRRIVDARLQRQRFDHGRERVGVMGKIDKGPERRDIDRQNGEVLR